MAAVEDDEQGDVAPSGSAPVAAAGATVELLVSYTVAPNYAGWRLDRYLAEKLRRLSRTRVQALIEQDLVCARRLKSSTAVWPGLTFQLRRQVRVEPTVPGPAALKIVYEDDALLVVDKPAGLPIHPTARYHHGTLVEQLKVRFGPGFRADPAHRLDRETSGLVVCGKTLPACQALMRAFVEGHPPREVFEVDAAIAEGTALVRIAVRLDAEHGKPAQTRFTVVEHFTRGAEPFSLLRCEPRTGRQHQIRVHLGSVGFPLVGDKIYGPDPGYFDRFSKHCLEPEAWARLRLPRHALHAARLRLPHPTTRALLELSSGLPDDLKGFLSGDDVR